MVILMGGVWAGGGETRRELQGEGRSDHPVRDVRSGLTQRRLSLGIFGSSPEPCSVPECPSCFFVQIFRVSLTSHTPFILTLPQLTYAILELIEGLLYQALF